MEWTEPTEPKGTWDPPYGDVPLVALDPVFPKSDEFSAWDCKPVKEIPAGTDAKFWDTGYNFPWYLKPLWLWHGLLCWFTTGKWPVQIMYFPKSMHRDKELYVNVLREQGVLQEEPRAFGKKCEDIDFDDLFKDQE